MTTSGAYVAQCPLDPLQRRFPHRRGIICRPHDAKRIRLLTHADISDDAIDITIAAFGAEWPATSVRAV